MLQKTFALLLTLVTQCNAFASDISTPSSNIKAIENTATRPCDMAQVNTSKLDLALKWIDNNRNYIDSFIVKYCDRVLVEKYYNGFKSETPHELQSATKTFTSTLIAIALKDGLIKNLDQPVLQLLPKYSSLLVGEKSRITVRHLLTMTSGLKWTDFGDNNSFQRIDAATDSVAFVLNEPLETKPGEKFFYNTGSSHLLAAIIHYNVGTTVDKYAEQKLFKPLQIGTYTWPKLKDGVNQGGWGMYMKPLDFIKLSQLYRDGGIYNGQRIIDKSYVDDAMKAHVMTNYSGSGYGYQMWIEQDFGLPGVAGARGYGGQDAFVLPEQQMSVSFTGSIEQPAQMAKDVKQVMKGFVIPAYQGGVR